MNKKQFEVVEIQTLLLCKEDVITTSGATTVKGEYNIDGTWGGLQDANDGTEG